MFEVSKSQYSVILSNSLSIHMYTSWTRIHDL